MRHLAPYVVAAMAFFATFVISASAQTVRDIAFPTSPSARLTDSFGDGRSGGRTHEGEDIMGEKMMPLYAAIDGWVRYIVDPEEAWGYAVVLEDQDGWGYHYLHVNNDTPGTDDGGGGLSYAYAPGIRRGASVTSGQLIGWMGDSGNAETVGAHLHFEMRMPDRTPIAPYPSLLAALNANAYSAADALAVSPDIGADKGIVASPDAPCAAGSLVKTVASPAVYYCGADGRRYVFPNANTYASWYADYSTVITITPERLATMVIGGNVTYRPGKRMVKITTDPKVYVVDRGGVLRWVQTAELAAQLYGVNWAKQIDDVPDAFFVNYRIGAPVSAVR